MSAENGCEVVVEQLMAGAENVVLYVQLKHGFEEGGTIEPEAMVIIARDSTAPLFRRLVLAGSLTVGISQPVFIGCMVDTRAAGGMIAMIPIAKEAAAMKRRPVARQMAVFV